MRYVQIAANTNQIALTVSPRTIASMVQATPPRRAIAAQRAIFAGVQRGFRCSTWSMETGGSVRCGVGGFDIDELRGARRCGPRRVGADASTRPRDAVGGAHCATNGGASATNARLP